MASELGLHLEERRLLEDWVLWGQYRGVFVQIKVRGKGQASLRVFLTGPAPAGLRVLDVASWPEVIWRQFTNFALEDESIEPSPRCRAQDPALGRAWMRQPTVLAVLRDLSRRRVFHSLSDSSLAGRLDNHRDDLPRKVLNDLVDAVLQLEGGLEVLPPSLASDDEAPNEPMAPAPDRAPDDSSQSPEAHGTSPDGLESASGAGDTVAELVMGLEAEGRLIDKGAFTLDRHAARETLRRAQLVAPQSFLWPLLRTAIARCARRIEVELGADLCLRFDGSDVTREEAEGCWPAVLAESPDPRDRSLRLLGIAMNAALAGSVGEAHLSSGGGAEGITWTIRAEGADTIEPRRRGSGGTEIRVARTGWARADRVRLAEELNRRLEWAPEGLELRVDGERVSTGGLSPRGARAVIPLGDGESEGAVGFSGEYLDGGRVQVVLDGVLAESLDEPCLLPGLVAVVSASDLAVDLSQRRVVRNQAWDRLRQALSHAGVEALKALVEELPSEEAAEAIDPTTETVLRACLGREWSNGPDDVLALARRLAALPLFPTIDGRKVSLQEVRGWLDAGEPLRYAGITLDRACLDPRLVRERLADPARILFWGWPLRPPEGLAFFKLGRNASECATHALLALPRDKARIAARIEREPWPGWSSIS